VESRARSNLVNIST